MSTKKFGLFTKGSMAAHQVFGVGGLYVCPLCGNGYPQASLSDGTLTLEHVPPAALGGKAICLTCRSCNTTAGGSVDAAASRRHEQRRFIALIAGTDQDYVGNAKLEIGGEVVNVRVSRSPGRAIVLDIVGGHNDPAVVQRTAAYLDGMAAQGLGDGEKYKITSRVRYHKRRSQVSFLRAAYLVAFAAFGYRYVFDRAVAPVRQQIEQPDEKVIGPWTIGFSKDPEAPAYLLLVAKSPLSLIVKLRETGVILPLPGTEDIHSDLADKYSPNERFNATGSLVPWPTTLEMAWDFPERPEQGR